MYLQITTKCNMLCDHCCYSCNKNGKHGDYSTILDGIDFARNYTECISIGGGEPTLHPRFFDILRICLEDFDSVWMATNGSRTKSMRRLYDILNDEEYYNRYNNDFEPILAEGKLTVALSLDPFHAPINENIKRLWETAANQHKRTCFDIRNVAQFGYDQIKGQGRAKKNGYWGKGCVCSDVIIKPDGKLRMCGCTNSPVIGDVYNGIEYKWRKYMKDNQKYLDSICFNG